MQVLINCLPGLNRRISELLWKIKRNWLATTAHAHVFTWYGLGYQNEIWQNHLIFRKSSETNGGSVKLCGRKIVTYTSPGYILLKCFRTLYSNVLVSKIWISKTTTWDSSILGEAKTWWILSVLNENTLKTEVLKQIRPPGWNTILYVILICVDDRIDDKDIDSGHHNLSS